nr:PREDICTED: uncharacterized protein LOC103282078 [Anolis carolinensis]|eukprot:XP_008122807.2 PREDICTED: uncharacterized protein LOC103282078 [Anolis carolinensis]
MEEAPRPTFQDELGWCIARLETGLLRLNPTPKQAEETQRVLKVLRSRKAPVVKKRQAMRHALGDYRVRMEEEVKSAARAATKPEISRAQPGGNLGSELDQEQPSPPAAVSASWFTPSDNSFQFGFDPSGKNSGEVGGAEGAREQPVGHNPSATLGFSAGSLGSGFAFHFAIPPPSAAADPGSGADTTEADAPTDAESQNQKPTLPEPARPDRLDAKDEEARRDGERPAQEGPTSEASQAAAAETKADLTVPASGKRKKKKKKKKKDLPFAGAHRDSPDDGATSHGKGTSEHPDNSQADEQVKREVDWCVEQLELGLKTQKSTPKQMDEAFRAMRVLRSEKAALAKKRQLMKTMFGDYRAQMAEERRKQLKLMQAASKAAHIAEVAEDTCKNRGQVFWKSAERLRSERSPGESSLRPAACSAFGGTSSFKFASSQGEFCFNFF